MLHRGRLITGTGLDHDFLAWGAFARRPAEAIAEISGTVHRALTGVPAAPNPAKSRP